MLPMGFPVGDTCWQFSVVGTQKATSPWSMVCRPPNRMTCSVYTMTVTLVYASFSGGNPTSLM